MYTQEMDNPNQILFEQESQSSRLGRKTKENPFFPIAIAGCLATCAYGAYMFKRKGRMSTSVFLMQLRVAAQGVAIGTLTVGMAYTMYKDHFLNKDQKD